MPWAESILPFCTNERHSLGSIMKVVVIDVMQALTVKSECIYGCIH